MPGQRTGAGKRARGIVASLAMVVSTVACIVGAGLWVEVNALRHDRNVITVRALKEQPMSLTRCWKSGDDTIRVSTEQGVNPPGAGLVPEDSGDLSQETAAQADARHAARCAARLIEKPKTGDCP